MEKNFKILVFLLPVYLYRYTIRHFLGQRCRFYPSCSAYAIAAIQNHGIIRGVFLTMKRLVKCQPWHAGGIDEVPLSKKESNHS